MMAATAASSMRALGTGSSASYGSPSISALAPSKIAESRLACRVI
jgi:hypothetical protein